MRSEETMEYSHFPKKIPMRGGMRDRIDVGGGAMLPGFRVAFGSPRIGPRIGPQVPPVPVRYHALR